MSARAPRRCSNIGTDGSYTFDNAWVVEDMPEPRSCVNVCLPARQAEHGVLRITAAAAATKPAAYTHSHRRLRRLVDAIQLPNRKVVLINGVREGYGGLVGGDDNPQLANAPHNEVWIYGACPFWGSDDWAV